MGDLCPAVIDERLVQTRDVQATCDGHGLIRTLLE